VAEVSELTEGNTVTVGLSKATDVTVTMAVPVVEA
jgi:hypothetical protein